MSEVADSILDMLQKATDEMTRLRDINERVRILIFRASYALEENDPAAAEDLLVEAAEISR